MCAKAIKAKYQAMTHLLDEDFVGEGGVCSNPLLPALPPDEDAFVFRLVRAV